MASHSSLFQPDPGQFAITGIALHNTAASPAVTIAVLPCSGLSVTSHTTTSRIEYVQDPEVHSSPDPVSVAEAEEARGRPSVAGAPSLLLKVHAGDGFRLTFDLHHRGPNSLPPTSPPTSPPSTAPVPALIPTSSSVGTTDATSTGFHSHPTDTASTTKSSQIQEDGPLAVEPPVRFPEVVSGSPSTVSPRVTLHPELYFVETSCEKEIRDLCDENEFQQQLKENSGMITPVVLPPSEGDTFQWDWNYSSRDHVEDDIWGHKTIFAFLRRDISTGSIAVLSQFSLWIINSPLPDQPSSIRFSAPQTGHSIANGRHWRRASTPEKFSSSANRLPTFHSKATAIPASYNSLPSLPDAASGMSARVHLSDGPGHSVSSSSSSNSAALARDTEDGPLFRATVVECENHIRDMKTATKKIIKAAQTVMDARKAWVQAEEVFIKELEGFRPAEPLLTNYLRPMSQSLAERSEVLGHQMRNLLIEPLSRFYGNDIKAAEAHRKAFDEESKDYYTFLSRYMAMKQESNRKKSEADAKYEKKRRHFEIKRFEYWGFLLDMRVGGSKSDEILHHLTNYSEKHCRNMMDMALLAEDLKPGLDAIASDLLESHKRAAIVRRERQERKKELLESQDDSFTGPHPSQLLAKGGSNLTSNMALMEASPTPISNGSTEAGQDTNNLEGVPFALEGQDDASKDGSGTDLKGSQSTPPNTSVVFGASQLSNNSTPKFSGIRDLEHQDIDAGSALGRRKEGFLFATSRPSLHNNSNVLEKPNINWHKYWCVVSEGHLHEYSHWKKGATMLHNEPINLKISTVRSCRNQDRRFCFEVITPKFRRVYQATSAEDMNSWISVISNAIQSLLNGTSSCQNLGLYSAGRDNKSAGVPGVDSLMAGLGSSGRASMDQVLHTLPTSVYERSDSKRNQVWGRSGGHGLKESARLSDADQRDNDQLGTRLLQTMREVSATNSFCAECGAKNPDWCAINLGILICIECSGIHRSLGTHISKVRSFTLDTTSYTRDLFDFIRAVGNEASNKIWEANLVQSLQQISNLDGQGGTKVVFRKPLVNDPREYKVAFIQKKYVERAFVNVGQFSGSGKGHSSAFMATKALFQASVVNNILGVISAYAAGADLNAVQKAEEDGSLLSTELSHSTERALEGKEATLSDQQLQSSLEGFSAGSEASSRFSRSTMASSVLNIPGVGQAQGQDSLDIVSPTDSQDFAHGPSSELSESSFMATQTSPLLLALRHGVPFSLDDQFEVYPLAEFMLQNGASSNLSVEVKLVEDEQEANLVEGGLTNSSPSSTTQAENTASGTSNGWEVDPEDIRNFQQRSNRRSLGQVVHMRGEGGATAMEYLRAKSAARGETMPGSPPTAHHFPQQQLAGPTEPAPSKSNDPFTGHGSPPTFSPSASTAMSPRLRPQSATLGMSSVSAPTSVQPSPSPPGGSSIHVVRHPPTSNHQDISNLFQKRRESDGGLGPALFAATKATEAADRNSRIGRTGDPSALLSTSPPASQHPSQPLPEASPQSSGHSSNSRAHKVKATLSKSLRLSAAYIKNNMMKEDKEYPVPVPALTLAPTQVATVTAASTFASNESPTALSGTNAPGSSAETTPHTHPTSGSLPVSTAPTSTVTALDPSEPPLSGPYVILHKKGSMPPSQA